MAGDAEKYTEKNADKWVSTLKIDISQWQGVWRLRGRVKSTAVVVIVQETYIATCHRQQKV